jgi:hypothetical protein
MDNPGGTEKPVVIRAVTRDELTNRCEICGKLALWIAESRLTNDSSAYCGEDILMFVDDPSYEVPPQLRGKSSR